MSAKQPKAQPANRNKQILDPRYYKPLLCNVHPRLNIRGTYVYYVHSPLLFRLSHKISLVLHYPYLFPCAGYRAMLDHSISPIR